jgi:hypothetical protein
MTAVYDPDEVRVLCRDLAEVTDARLPNSYKQAGDAFERNHLMLAGVVRAIMGDDAWWHSPYQALHDVIRDAIAELPETFGGDRASYKNSPERYIAEILFGFRNDEIPSRYIDGALAELSYSKDYLPYAVKASGVGLPLDTRRNMTNRVRRDLAHILLDMKREASKRSELASAAASCTKSSSQAVSTGHDGYVPRP